MTEQPPTQLARPVDATEASLAWAIDTTPEVVAYRPAWVTRTAVAAALVLIAGAGVVALTMRGEDQAPVIAEPVTSTVATTPSAEPEPTTSASRETSTPRPVEPPTSRAPIETAAMRKPPPPPEPTLAPPLWTVAHDAQFIAALRANGWSIWDETAMANNAHYICTWLRNGDTPVRATSRLNGITPGEAWSITQTAMAVYPNCP